MAQVRVANDAAGVMNASVTAVATTFALQAGQGALFPQITGGDWFYVTATTSGGVKEVMKCTGISGDTLTVTRGVDGTTAQTFVAGNSVQLRWNAAILTDLQAQITPTVVGALNQFLPLNLVMVWTGSIASIPAGWQLCDGTNGSPNLKDKFVIGAGNLYTTGTTGGATTAALATANLPVHTHAIVDNGHSHAFSQSPHNHTISDPGHSHNMNANSSNAVGGSTALFTGKGATSSANYGSSVSGVNGVTIAAANANLSINTGTTGITTANTGSGTAFSVMPPYYAYAFICKTAAWT